MASDVDNRELAGASGATVAFDLIRGGTYRSWLRVFWAHGCANSVLLQMDDRPMSMAGNDGTYQVWHWVAGPEFALEAGPHQLVLIPREASARSDPACGS